MGEPVVDDGRDQQGAAAEGVPDAGSHHLLVLGVPHAHDQHEDGADTGLDDAEEEAVGEDAGVAGAGRGGEHDDGPHDGEGRAHALGVEALGQQGARVHAGDVTEVEDERHPGVRVALRQAKIRAQAEDGGLAEQALIVVLDGIGEAQHRHQTPVDLAQQPPVRLRVDRDRHLLRGAGIVIGAVVILLCAWGRNGVLDRRHAAPISTARRQCSGEELLRLETRQEGGNQRYRDQMDGEVHFIACILLEAPGQWSGSSRIP